MGEGARARRLRMRMRLNVLCLAGALLSLGFCLLPWTISYAHTNRSGTTQVQLTATGYATGSSSAEFIHLILVDIPGWDRVVLGAQIFLVGLALSFLTPLGGFVQLTGMALFRGSVGAFLGTHAGVAILDSAVTTSVNLTYYLGLAGAFLVILSLFFQFSPDFKWSTTKLKDRLFVYSKFRPEPRDTAKA